MNHFVGRCKTFGAKYFLNLYVVGRFSDGHKTYRTINYRISREFQLIISVLLKCFEIQCIGRVDFAQGF